MEIAVWGLSTPDRLRLAPEQLVYGKQRDVSTTQRIRTLRVQLHQLRPKVGELCTSAPHVQPSSIREQQTKCEIGGHTAPE
jgi:hypothetical protein